MTQKWRDRLVLMAISLALGAVGGYIIAEVMGK